MKRMLILGLLISMLCSCDGTGREQPGIVSPSPTPTATPLLSPAPTASPTPTPTPSLSIEPPPQSPEPVIADDEWVRELIDEYCSDGSLSNEFSFKFGSTAADVERDLGPETSDPNVIDFYKAYNNVWVFYMFGYYTAPNPAGAVIGVALNEGEKFFGIEVGASSIDDVRQLMGESWYDAPVITGFEVASPHQNEDGPWREPDGTYHELGYTIKSNVHEASVQFYFHHGVLETIYIYNPWR